MNGITGFVTLERYFPVANLIPGKILESLISSGFSHGFLNLSFYFIYIFCLIISSWKYTDILEILEHYSIYYSLS